MASTPVREPFHRPGWVYEQEYDGWRMLAFKDGSRVRLISRQGDTATGLRGAAIGVMCATRESRDIIVGQIRECGGVPILLDHIGAVRVGEPVPVPPDAIVTDLDHPECDEALDEAAAARVPVVAYAWRDAKRYARALVELPAADFLIRPDAKTLCRVLLSVLGRGESRTG